MPKLADYISFWQLIADGEPIETHSSFLQPVKRQEQPYMLKVFKPHSDERGSIGLLNFFDGQGMVRLLESDENAILIERCEPQPSLSNMMLQGDAEDDKAAIIIADVVQNLHLPRKSGPQPMLIPLEERFDSLFRRAKLTGGIYAEAAALARRLLASQTHRIPLHGDIHHANIMHSPRGWLALDPKGLLGDPHYEMANTLCNMYPHTKVVAKVERMERLAGLIASRLGLSSRRLLEFTFVHGALWASWAAEDKTDLEHGLACASTAGKILAQ